MVTSEEKALQMLLKQYPSGCPGEWVFIQRNILANCQGFDRTQTAV